MTLELPKPQGEMFVKTEGNVHMHISVMWIERDILGPSIIETSIFLPGKKGDWYLNRIRVNDQCQGMGIGGFLLRRLQHELKKLEEFRCLIVEPGGYGSDVSRLREFYARHGFKQAERQAHWEWKP